MSHPQTESNTLDTMLRLPFSQDHVLSHRHVDFLLETANTSCPVRDPAAPGLNVQVGFLSVEMIFPSESRKEKTWYVYGRVKHT